MHNSFTVSPGFVSAIMHAGSCMGLVLKSQAVDDVHCTQSASRMPLTTFAALLQHYRKLTSDDDIGLKLGQLAGPSCFSMLGQLVLAATTVGEGLLLARKFQRLITDCAQAECFADANQLAFSWTPYGLPPADARLFVDVVMSALGSFGAWATGTQPGYKSVYLQYKKPRNTKLLNSIFGENIHFGAQKNRLNIPIHLAEKPLRTGLPEIKSVLLEHASKQLACLGQTDDFASQLRRCISINLPSGRLNINAVAASLNVSPRTLQRKLRASGVSYGKILQEIRLERANRLLKECKLSLSEVSFQLGYSEQSAFSNAYKLWTGNCPTHVRGGLG